MKREFIDKIRIHELNDVLKRIGPLSSEMKVLDFGSGKGIQLKILKNNFNFVIGVDVEESNNKSHFTNNDVIIYDGVQLPFEDARFDVIFTSHVMEHVQELDSIDSELNRVLKPEGMIVHIVPSVNWKFMTLLTHIPSKIIKKVKQNNTIKNSGIQQQSKIKILSDKLLNFIIPPPHGERGNRLSEYFYFRNNWWLSYFKNRGWIIVENFKGSLIYSGHLILNNKISTITRNKLVKIFGSSSNVFLLKKK